MAVRAAIVTGGVLVDAGGFIIFIGSDGKIHIKKIPPWNPEVFKAIQVIQSSQVIPDKTISKKVYDLGVSMLSQNEKAVTKHLSEAMEITR
jgi:hypothetical protein